MGKSSRTELDRRFEDLERQESERDARLLDEARARQAAPKTHLEAVTEIAHLPESRWFRLHEPGQRPHLSDRFAAYLSGMTLMEWLDDPSLPYALDRLATEHPRLYRLLELRSVQGSTWKDIGHEIGVTERWARKLQKDTLHLLTAYRVAYWSPSEEEDHGKAVQP